MAGTGSVYPGNDHTERPQCGGECVHVGERHAFKGQACITNNNTATVCPQGEGGSSLILQGISL